MDLRDLGRLIRALTDGGLRPALEDLAFVTPTPVQIFSDRSDAPRSTFARWDGAHLHSFEVGDGLITEPIEWDDPPRTPSPASRSGAVVDAAGFGGLPLLLPGLAVVDHTESLARSASVLC